MTTTTAALVALGAVIALLAVFGPEVLRRLRHPLRRRSRLLVVTQDGVTFRGVATRVDSFGVLLVDVDLIDRDGSTRLDGAVFIDRPNISYVQAPEV